MWTTLKKITFDNYKTSFLGIYYDYKIIRHTLNPTTVYDFC